MKYLLVAVVILCLCSCYPKASVHNQPLRGSIDTPDQELLLSKGFDSMKQRIEPLIITAADPIKDIIAVNKPNAFVSGSGTENFQLVTLDKTGNYTINDIMPGFPGKLGNDYGSDDEQNVIWMARGRGLNVLDLATGTSGHIGAPINALTAFLQILLADIEKKQVILLCEILPKDNNPFSFVIVYDLIKNTKIFQSDPGFTWSLFRLENDRFLRCSADLKKGWFSWDVCDSHLNKIATNDLTKAMTKAQISIDDSNKPVKPIHLGKRKLIGYGPDPTNKDKNLSYIISWDENFEHVVLSPIITQLPNNEDFGPCTFSQDGNWIKTSTYKSEGFPAELVFYHVGPYPQGISPPMFGGYTNEFTKGAFFLHDTWGPCWVETDNDVPEKLFVYRLNDGLKILADEALKKMAKR